MYLETDKFVISKRFKDLVQLQLKSFENDHEINSLVVYIAQSKNGESPSLEAIGHWPATGKALPPVESDPDLRVALSERRWYPLQEGSILIGVLRAEVSNNPPLWTESLDKRLRATATSLAHCLALELDRKRLLDELNQQRSQIGLMVHQLRNPLAALRTYAQLLLKKLGPESIHKDLVKGLLTEQDQLNNYISALDELSSTNLPASENISEPLLLPPVLPKGKSLTIRSLIEPLIDRASATSNLQGREWRGPDLGWPSWTLEDRSSEEGIIAEIVANLLENAFRYSSPNAPIGLELNESGMCIWDGGEPIASEERSMIFEKGIRGSNASDSSGSGLGLSLGRELAQQLGCELILISPPSLYKESLPNKGNAFVLKFLPNITHK